ncbi:MAG: hypothetical protein QOD76_1038 [Solirubrobacteraceae bacterium]|nr:hypothetical protein [Solirubrobacteraceae bacterium]
MAAREPPGRAVTPLDVMLVFREADPMTGGLGVDIADVANGLTARGHRVTVATTASTAAAGGERPAGFVRDVEVARLRTFPGGRRAGVAYGLAPGIARLIDARPGALVHVYSCLPVYLHAAAAAAARGRHRPLVWTPMLHPARRASWRGYGWRGGIMAAFDAVVPRAARFVDAIAAATAAEAEAFRRHGARRVRVIPSAVHAVAPADDGAARRLRGRLGLGGGPLVLAVAGREERRKGLDFAMAAVSRMRLRLPSATLVVLGLPGPPRRLSASAVSLGRLSAGDLATAYRAADVVFVPSRYEAFSRVVIEAWQQERPAVVTDRVGLAETVREGGGSVVRFGDVDGAASAIAALVCHRTEALRQGRHGRATVQRRFLVDGVVDQLEALYAEVLHG